MRQGALIVFCTAIVFAAGFGVRAWTERVRPIPAVPVVAPVATPRTAEELQRQRAQMVANIQRWMADSEVFRKGVAALESEFETAFRALLTPRNEQVRAEWVQARFGNNANRGRDGGRGGPGQNPGQARGPDNRGGEAKAEPRPISDEEVERLRRAPLGLLARMLAIEEAAEARRQQYGLDEAQLAKTKALLQVRLDKFIALTSGISAMGIQYSALAQELDRLAAGLDPAATAPKPEAKPAEAAPKAK